jgi:hypothetical protein
VPSSEFGPHQSLATADVGDSATTDADSITVGARKIAALTVSALKDLRSFMLTPLGLLDINIQRFIVSRYNDSIRKSLVKKVAVFIHSMIRCTSKYHTSKFWKTI